jgi:DNA-binding NarL/FixJ family response regulator
VAEIERLGEAVRRVAAGGSVLAPEVVAQMLGRRRGDDPLDTLTGRERQVLELMAEGRTNRARSRRSSSSASAPSSVM